MAWAKADVPQAERDRLALDIPCLVGRNWSRFAITGWPRWTTDGNNGSADQSAANFDALFAKDDLDHVITKPNAAATIWYVNFDLGIEQGVVDCFFLFGHNLGTIGGVTLNVQIADDANFTTRPATIFTATPAGNQRLASFVVKEAGDTNAQRFTGIRYLRLQFSKGVAFTPEVSEVWIGRRTQLFGKPQLPFDQGRLVSSVRISESDSGIAHGSKRYVDRRILDYVYIVRPDGSGSVGEFTNFSLLETDGRTLPFLVSEAPSTVPQGVLLMRWNGDAPEHAGPTQTLDERRFEIHAIEHGKNIQARGGL